MQYYRNYENQVRLQLRSAEVKGFEKLAIHSAPHSENHSEALPLLDVDLHGLSNHLPAFLLLNGSIVLR